MSDDSHPQTVAEVKDELRQLKDFLQTTTAIAFQADLRNQYEEKIRSILEVAPQTVGDFFEREQAIGAARALKEAMDWLPEQASYYQTSIVEREAPPIST